MRKTVGFTLIELLVVIAIIAILASMLLPTLNSARERSKVALCMSNQRQSGQALIQYANDYNDFIPRGNNWDGSNYLALDQYWTDLVMRDGYLPDIRTLQKPARQGVGGSYVPERNVFSCPVLPPPTENYQVCFNFTATGRMATTALSFGIRNVDTTSSWRYFPGEREYKKLPKMAFLKKEFPYMGDSIRFWGGTYNVNPGQASGLGFDDASAGGWWPINSGHAYMAHKKTTNMWFPDGHGENLTYFAIRNIKRPNNASMEVVPSIR